MLSVLKIGGSVLRDDASYAAAARYLHDRLALHRDERLVIIVSAAYGMTDALLHEATAIVRGSSEREAGSDLPHAPDNAALDLLWSTGELRSVAILALHLQRLGVPAAPFNVHQTGLIAESTGATTVRPLQLLAALTHARIVIVPGFLGVNAGGAVMSLGRGGSDLTAILLAAALRADVCELIKDVPGYFTADPRACPDARPIHDLSVEEALRMADAGCELVQRAALAAASAAALPLVVRSFDAAAPVTTVHSRSRSSHGVRHQDDSRRAAVRA